LNQLWYKDTTKDLADANMGYSKRQNYTVKIPANRGTFSFAVPLKHTFGFCEDYDNVLYGFNYVLTLTRQSDNGAIIREDAAGAGIITLTNLDWMIPMSDQQMMRSLLSIKLFKQKLIYL
jgi:hypothetical protein